MAKMSPDCDAAELFGVLQGNHTIQNWGTERVPTTFLAVEVVSFEWHRTVLVLVSY
jgi:hypothetical protein